MLPMTRCPTEWEWDRYVLDPEIPEHEALALHLHSCPYCLLLVNELHKEWRSVRGPIILVSLEDSWTDMSQQALAAMGATNAREPESATLASDDRGIWLRAVRDPSSHDLWLYLNSEEGEPIARQAIVRPFGTEQDLLTDDLGRINLGQIAWPEKDMLRAEVRLPKAVFHLAPITVSNTSGGTTELTTTRGDKIRLSWKGDRINRCLQIDIATLRDLVPDTPIKIAIRSDPQLSPFTIRTIPPTGTASFEGVDDSGSLEIYIYQ